MGTLRARGMKVGMSFSFWKVSPEWWHSVWLFVHTPQDPSIAGCQGPAEHTVFCCDLCSGQEIEINQSGIMEQDAW